MNTYPAINLGEATEVLAKYNEKTALSTDFFTKDSEFLSGLDKLETPGLMEKITEFLVGERRPGSSEYMNVFSKSAILDKELKLLESDNFDAKKIEQLGLPLMIDTQKTTQEMIHAGQAVLTQEARLDFLGATISLKYKMEQHLGKSAKKAADYYSAELSKTGVTETLKNVLGIKPEPYEIPFTPDGKELMRLKELFALKVNSRKEARQVLRTELEQMMRNRPESIGLGAVGTDISFFVGVAETLGGNGTGPLNVDRLRDLHELMSNGPDMRELQIYPGFTKAVEENIESNLP